MFQTQSYVPTESSMIASKAMQVPRDTGGLLQVSSSEETGAFREAAISVTRNQPNKHLV